MVRFHSPEPLQNTLLRVLLFCEKNKQEVQGNYNSTIGVIPINDIIETIIGAIKDLGVPAILLFLVTRYYTNKDKREEDKRKAALEQAKNSNERLTKLETEVKRQAEKDEELYNNVRGIKTAVDSLVEKLDKESVLNEKNARSNADLLRERILDMYSRCYEKQSYLSMHDRESLEHLYQDYKALGGNGMIDDLYSKLTSLKSSPDE